MFRKRKLALSLFLLSVNWSVVVRLVSADNCNSGCYFADEKRNDGFCDCDKCDDEVDWNCNSCPGCPSATCNGARVECGLPTTTQPPDTALLHLSYIISDDNLELDNFCEPSAVLVDDEVEYLSPKNGSGCNSLRYALSNCTQMTKMGEFVEIADEWMLDFDDFNWNHSVAIGCEFLFVHWDWDVRNPTPLQVNSYDKNKLELARDVGAFQANIYPWHLSWNKQLVDFLRDEGAVEKQRASVELSEGFLLICDTCNNVTKDVSMKIGSLELSPKMDSTNVIDVMYLHALIFNNTNTPDGVVYADISDIQVAEDKMTNFIFQYATGVSMASGNNPKVAATYVGHLMIADSTFADFTSTAISAEYSSVVVSGCEFRRMSQPLTATGSNMRVENSLFSEHSHRCVYADSSNMTFAKCNFTDSKSTNGGGALLGTGSTTTLWLNDCIFQRNLAKYGGAVVVSQSALLFADGCQFTNNSATDSGGAVYLGSDALDTSSDELYSHLKDCVLSTNVANKSGGAVYIGKMGSFEKCTIEKNIALEGGGVFLLTEATTTISQSTIVGNMAIRGGFLFADSLSKVEMDSTVLALNSGERGGAILLTFLNVLKSVDNVYADNGAVQRGGAVLLDWRNEGTFVGDTFDGNWATNGAHIYAETNTEFAANGSHFANGDCVNGGVVLLAMSAAFADCHFASNRAKEVGAALLLRFSEGIALRKCAFARNNATFGGAVAVTDSTDAAVEFVECGFAENWAAERGAAVATQRNFGLRLSLWNASFSANAVGEGVGGALAMVESKANGFEVRASAFAANRAMGGYTAGLYADAPESRLQVADCQFAGNEAADAWATAVFVEAMGSLLVERSAFRADGVFVRAARSVQLTANAFGEDSAVTLLNSDEDAIGGLLVADNWLNASALLRSFPVELSLAVVRNEAHGENKVCPKCEMTAAVRGTDLFGNDYAPLQWCDLKQTCYDVALRWSPQSSAPMEPRTSAEAPILEGFGNATFWLTPLAKNGAVNLSLACVPQTDVIHVCAFNESLTRALRVTDCPKGRYERDTGGGKFECDSIDSLSADKYSWISDESFFWFFVALALAIAFAVGYLWLKEKKLVRNWPVFCCAKSVEGSMWYAPALYAWHCFDFLSDVNLTQSLFQVYAHTAARGFNTATNWQWLALAICSLFFVLLPFALNMYFTWSLPDLLRDVAPNNGFARLYVKNFAKVVAFACIWSGNLYPSLQLVNSRVLGFNALYMGLTKSQRRVFLKYRMINILVENMPQLVIQILVLIKDATDGDSSKLSATVLLSFLSSFMSALAVCFEHALGKDKLETEAKVEFFADISVRTKSERIQISGKDIFAFTKNCHRFRTVARALSEELGAEWSALELGSVSLRGDGCQLYGQVPARIAAQNAAAAVDQTTYARIWNEILGANSPVSGTFRFEEAAATQKSMPLLHTVLSTDTPLPDAAANPETAAAVKKMLSAFDEGLSNELMQFMLKFDTLSKNEIDTALGNLRPSTKAIILD